MRTLTFLSLLLLPSAAFAVDSQIQTAADQAVRAACSDCIDGISFKDLKDKTTWRLDFKADATEEQRKVAQKAVAAFDLSAVPVKAVEGVSTNVPR